MSIFSKEPNSSSSSEPPKQPKCTDCGLHHSPEWECNQKLALRKASEAEVEAKARLKKQRAIADALAADLEAAARHDESMRRLNAALELQARREKFREL